MDQSFIDRIVEAALLASPQPLTLAQLGALFPEEAPAPPGALEKSLETLREACSERGIELIEVASGFRYQVKTDVHPWVARLWTERQTKYTRATLETLALIAYRQPITRGEIEQIRGVTVNPNTIKSLEEREWIRVIGHRDVPGKPALFGTTRAFLDYFNLKSLDQLPPLAELRDIPDLEPELPFDQPISANVVINPSIEILSDPENTIDLGLVDTDQIDENQINQDLIDENPIDQDQDVTTEIGDDSHDANYPPDHDQPSTVETTANPTEDDLKA